MSPISSIYNAYLCTQRSRFTLLTGGTYTFLPLAAYHPVAKIKIPPNMATFQFIVWSSTGVLVGKKQKTKKGSKNTRATAFTTAPFL